MQDIRALAATPSSSPKDTPRSRASPKIRGCCELAEKHGYRWAWIDTCCIDKTSSAELSEAINSMFDWYRQAAVCYVYLHDVTSHELGPTSEFYRSRWFTRGWTLQELIAPTSLIFFTKQWSILGTRTDLADDVAKITGVDTDILLHHSELGTVSISQKMSWAAHRETTRLEDRAYSLLGIFGVNMPTIYGEGRAAFYRLQEEIMKVSSDQTIFAWGKTIELQQLEFGKSSSMDVPEAPEARCLLAISPNDFSSPGLPLEPIPVDAAIAIVKKTCVRLNKFGFEQTVSASMLTWTSARSRF